MAVFIYRETRLNKCLDSLRKGDKKSSMAADRAEELIGKLLEEDLAILEEATNRTKHGELRIDKCRKYDLGSGYRMVCVEQGGDLFITYVGPMTIATAGSKITADSSPSPRTSVMGERGKKRRKRSEAPWRWNAITLMRMTWTMTIFS
jgi:hypothetical protein